MIRRLQHQQLLESVTPMPVGGGRVLQAAALPQEDMAAADELDAQAYRQGYAEGFQAGEQDGRREAEQYQQAWEAEIKQGLEEEYRALVREKESLAALVSGLHEQLEQQHQSTEQLSFELAMAALTHAFGAMHEDRALLRRLCQQLVQEYRGKVVRLEVSVADRSSLPEQLDGFEIVVEHGLVQGECRVVSARGRAESSVATRLEAIHQAMLDAAGVIRG